MLKKIFFLTLILGLSLSISAQKKELKTKFGKISDEEFAMTSYKDDPNAPAVILFDKGYLTFTYDDNKGFIQEYNRHVRIKILKKEAYDFANITIPYYDGTFTKQRIGELKAVCYIDKNHETAMKNESVFDEKLTKNLKIKKFTIPGIKEGCIIEYKYSIYGENIGEIPDWTFQRLVPTVWSEFEARIPQHFIFAKMSQGFTPFSIAEETTGTQTSNINFSTRETGYTNQSQHHSVKLSFSETRMRYVQENIPAFKPEKFISSPYDYVTKIMFQIKEVYNVRVERVTDNSYQLVNASPIDIASSWQRIGKDFLEDYLDDYLKSDKYTAENAQQVVSSKATDKEKLEAIYDFIGKNYQYNGHDYFTISQSLKDLTTKHTGTATDLNVLLINMLRKVGIKAYPVLLSTRSNGHLLTWYPQLNAINRIIVAVDLGEKENILVDMSEYPHPLGLLPLEDLNGEGLLLKSKDEIDWVSLQNKINNRKAIMSNLTLSTEGVLSGDVTVSTTGYETVETRKTIKASDSKKYAELFLKELISEGSLVGIKLDNVEADNEPNLKGTYSIKTSAFVNKSDNKMYISPTLCFSKKENPFKDPERKLDISMGASNEEAFTFVFKLPDGYKVDEMPKSSRFKLNENDLTFEYLTENKDNQIKITMRYKLKKTNYTAEEYSNLRNIYAQLISKMGEQIVLSKI